MCLIRLNPIEAATWNGINTDWNNPINWSTSPSLPSFGEDLTINPNNYTHAPEISAISLFIPGSIIIENGGWLTVSANLTGNGGDFLIYESSNMIVNTGIIANFINLTIIKGSLTINGGDMTITDDLIFQDNEGSVTLNSGTLTLGETGSGRIDFNGFINNQIALFGGELVCEDLGDDVDISIENGGELAIEEYVNLKLTGDIQNNGQISSAVNSQLRFSNSGSQLLSGSGSTVLNDVVIEPSAVVTFNSDVQVAGDWTVLDGGTFISNGSTILFNGSIDQCLTGNTTITNLTINKPSGKILNEGGLRIDGTLDVASPSEFDADGSGSGVTVFTSSALNDSRVAQLPSGASVTGVVVFERYLEGLSQKRWRNIGFGVSGATVLDLQNEILISGSFTGTDNGSSGIPMNAGNSLTYYDNTTGLPSETQDDRWVYYPQVSNTEFLTAGGTEARGFSIWIRDLSATTFDLSGTLNQGDIALPITGDNEGWNFVANPYLSAVDWDLPSGWNKTSIQGNAIYIWTGAQYLTWNGSVGSLETGVLAKGQGFWVLASDISADVTITEAAKATGSPSVYRTASAVYLEVALTDGVYTDKAYIQFKEEAELSKDSYDAEKLKQWIFNLFTLSADGADLAINVIPNEFCSLSIPLKLHNTQAGSYSLSVSNINSLDPWYIVRLEDTKREVFHEASDLENIAFEIPAEGGIGNRFILHIGSVPIEESFIVDDVVSCSGNPAFIIIENAQEDVSYDLVSNGNVVAQGVSNNGTLELEISPDLLGMGANVFKLKGSIAACSVEFSAEVTVEVVAIEEPIISVEGDKLVSSAIAGNQWFRNGVELVGAVEQTLLLDGRSAAYHVEVSDRGCSASSIIWTITGVQDELKQAGISIYPNPIVVWLNIEVVGEALVKIYNLNGEKVYELDVKESKMLNLSGLKAGLYTVQVHQNGSLHSVEVFKK